MCKKCQTLGYCGLSNGILKGKEFLQVLRLDSTEMALESQQNASVSILTPSSAMQRPRVTGLGCPLPTFRMSIIISTSDYITSLCYHHFSLGWKETSFHLVQTFGTASRTLAQRCCGWKRFWWMSLPAGLSFPDVFYERLVACASGSDKKPVF